MTEHRSARYLLEALAEAGVEYIFANMGTDHVALIEELAGAGETGLKAPKVVLCPHEVVAVHMAGGYAMATGRGQAVLVHVDAGSANALMAIQNLRTARVPVLLLAGRAPHTLRGESEGSRDNYVHFVQDPFDIGAIMRSYVKWEYTLPTGLVVKEAVRRAISIIHSDPQGPAYMLLPRETLAERFAPQRIRTFSECRYGPIPAQGIDIKTVSVIADELLTARQPVMVTSYLGRRPKAVSKLREIAQLCGVKVVEFMPSTLNFPRGAACFGGFDTTSALKGCDLGIMLDIDVPWLPKYAPWADNIRWLHIDVDPLKGNFPMWGFATDLRVQGDCATILEQLLTELRGRIGSEYRSLAQGRVTALQKDSDTRRKKYRAASLEPGSTGQISAAHALATLNSMLDPEDIIVNEAIRNAPSVLEQIPRDEPGTYFAPAGGGLGFSGGVALGLKLAYRARRVVQIVGDGSFHLSAPDSVFVVAQQAALPILTVVLDNFGWQAVKSAVLREYPDGHAAKTGQFFSTLEGSGRDFSHIAHAFGAYGILVDHPAKLTAGFREGLNALDAGRSALVHIRLAPHYAPSLI